ncbi:hypothetical protein OF820_08885 [Oceanotoga sp. DSM 15011]|uniref:hypothetical protein n=1 Tax=Oceanotoga sp. DSM 15011 TaxID=2984951 RepID=UPI0021F3E85A|nr:hypothetical protein [Oceanotoga sp. DSM 15011]UYO99187.1 hypothetical protein OF820_08885 [Oceanotoga sp. DSM 15011]
MNKIYSEYLKILDKEKNYYSNWTYDKPIGITIDTNSELKRTQQIMYKLINYFVANYEKYEFIMPISTRAKEILNFCKRKKYEIGTYRTDFVIDELNSIKLIEITCRFALNGFIRSGFVNALSENFIIENGNFDIFDQYSSFYDHLLEYFGDFKRICVVEGDNSSKNESKVLIPLFKSAGYEVSILNKYNIEDNLNELNNSAIFLELSHEELFSLSNKTINKLIDSKILNDLRTVILVHDKRMFSLLSDESFQREVLSEEDMEFFNDKVVKTYTRKQRKDLWEEAKNNKDNWILKPSVLGMGINVFAGNLLSDSDWNKIFDSELIEDMILQPYIKQKKFKGTVKGVYHLDYVAGTMLNFGNNYFGAGLFRASSYPITNKVDDRKISSVVTENIEFFDSDNIL